MFLLIIGILSTGRNIFFPIIAPLGFLGHPTFKLVIGFPTFLIPDEFEGCIVYGLQFYILFFMINVLLYYPLAAYLEYIFKKINQKYKWR